MVNVCVNQGILNILNDEAFLAKIGFQQPVLGFLPCRWSLFPSLDWHPAWEKLELWPPAMIARHRYPGIVSRDQVEHYCPDVADLLSSFAFVPLTGSRQARVREYAALGAEPRARYCSSQRLGEPCCACGEPAALVHVAGRSEEMARVAAAAAGSRGTYSRLSAWLRGHGVSDFQVVGQRVARDGAQGEERGAPLRTRQARPG